jgi:hypothetical protein
MHLTMRAPVPASHLLLSGVLLRALLPWLMCIVGAEAASTEPLLQISDLTYQGSFRVPNDQLGTLPYSEFSFDDDGFAYDPAAHGLFIKGHTYGQLVAEISIPTPVMITDGNLANLTTCTLLQPFADPTYGNLDEQNIANGMILGGLLPYKGVLIGSTYAYYDGGAQQTLSHFIASSTLSVNGFQGLFAVGPLPVRRQAGYLGNVPSEWQASLGGPVLTGHGGGTIITQSSAGPSIWTFDPAQLGVENPVPATPLVYYDADSSPTLGTWASTGTSNPQFNACSNFTGVVFVPGTRTVLVFGNTGLGIMGYGDPTSDPALNGTPAPDGSTYWYDPTGGGKGQHAYPYSAYVWAYDANVLAQAAAGSIPPYAVLPYASGPLTLPINSGTNYLNGAAYDPATGRLYITQQGGDTVAAYSDLPLIHVYSLTPGTTSLIPVITSVAAGNGVVGAPLSYQVTASNSPVAYTVNTASGSLGALPPGLTISVNGLINGTPTTAGTFPIALSATNASGTGNEMLTLTIAATQTPIPVITGPATVSGTVGATFSCQVVASETPGTYGASGLPPGLAINTGSGLISGTPTAAGSFAVGLSASNASGTGTASLTISLTGSSSASPPVVSVTGLAAGSVGQAFAYQIIASNAPTGFTASPLPPGLSLDAGTGLISGTPTLAWIGPVVLTATNASGTGDSSLSINIAASGGGPEITSPTSAYGTVGIAFSYQIVANAAPTRYTVNGLPPGLSVNAATGVISGTPTASGVTDATMFATNASNSTGTTLAITIAPGSGGTASDSGTSTGTMAGGGSSGGSHCGVGGGLGLLLAGWLWRGRRRQPAASSTIPRP